MRIVLDVWCGEEVYLLVIVETSNGHEVSVHDSRDIALYSSTWGDNANSQMLSSIPVECREKIAKRAEWVLREYEGGLEGTPLGDLLERAVRALRSI